MKTVAFKTLGCRLNQYETDALVTQFDHAGYRIVDFKSPADITVINTCTVTNQSDQKSRNTISQAARTHKEGLVVVTGCMADHYKEKLESDEQVTYVVDNRRKSQIVSLVDAHYRGEVVQPGSLPGDVFGFESVDKSLHTRTFIKIQDGCDNFCTYCIVPSVRGRAVSRPPGEILDNVRRVIDHGFREIVITGVNIGRYASGGIGMEQILEKILELPGDFRVRISSIEPDGFGTDFHKLFQHPKLAPHLHLCLQSGSDQILLKMRRMYTVGSFFDIIHKFRNQIPGFNFTTDVIVGFPGESKEDFSMTLSAIREAQFSHVHTFRYSKRKGTRADRMENQLPEKVKSERSEQVRALSGENRLRYMASMEGRRERVLVEKVDKDGTATGYGANYLPVRFRSNLRETNRFEDVILGKVVPEKTPFLAARTV